MSNTIKQGFKMRGTVSLTYDLSNIEEVLAYKCAFVSFV